MSTTTVRVDRETHARLVAIAQANGQQLVDVMRDATAALERERFGVKVAGELEELRRDPAAWADYVGEAELALRDGLS